MKPKLLIDYFETEDIVYIKMSGVIDEDNYLSQLKFIKPVFIINPGDLQRINSCGVKDWIKWITALRREVYLVECPPIFIMQVNLLKDFLNSSTILSFYVPYYCSGCDLDDLRLLEVSQVLATKPFRPPEAHCRLCDTLMEVDTVEDVYFSFLDHQQQPTVPDDVQQVIQTCASSLDLERFCPES